MPDVRLDTNLALTSDPNELYPHIWTSRFNGSRTASQQFAAVREPLRHLSLNLGKFAYSTSIFGMYVIVDKVDQM